MYTLTTNHRDSPPESAGPARRFPRLFRQLSKAAVHNILAALAFGSAAIVAPHAYAATMYEVYWQATDFSRPTPEHEIPFYDVVSGSFTLIIDDWTPMQNQTAGLSDAVASIPVGGGFGYDLFGADTLLVGGLDESVNDHGFNDLKLTIFDFQTGPTLVLVGYTHNGNRAFTSDVQLEINATELPPSPVPLPAPAALLLGGLGALAALRRRRMTGSGTSASSRPVRTRVGAVEALGRILRARRVLLAAGLALAGASAAQAATYQVEWEASGFQSGEGGGGVPPFDTASGSFLITHDFASDAINSSVGLSDVTSTLFAAGGFGFNYTAANGRFRLGGLGSGVGTVTMDDFILLVEDFTGNATFDAVGYSSGGFAVFGTATGSVTVTPIDDIPAPVPLPAAGFLLLAAVGGLTLMRRSQ